MEIKGEYDIASPREAVWAALNDPQVLQECIPGCESMEKKSATELDARVVAKIGPVKAKFNTSISLEDLNPPESYTLVGEGKAGAAGFGRGAAQVTLDETADGTRLSYKADFKVGGKLAQVGSRLVLGATRKTADEFFHNFSQQLDPGATRLDDEMPLPAAAAEPGISKTWLATGAAVVVLLIWWFLLR